MPLLTNISHAEFALEAFTKDSDNTEEHHAEQIQVQRGMGKNYERLEFIGTPSMHSSAPLVRPWNDHNSVPVRWVHFENVFSLYERSTMLTMIHMQVTVF